MLDEDGVKTVESVNVVKPSTVNLVKSSKTVRKSLPKKTKFKGEIF